jgi:hypothetical protein
MWLRMTSRALSANSKDRLLRQCSNAHIASDSGALPEGVEKHMMCMTSLESSAAAEGRGTPDPQETGQPADAHDEDKRASACERIVDAAPPLADEDGMKALRT